MITDGIISWIQALSQFIYNLMPAITSGVFGIPSGQNAATYAINTVNTTIGTWVTGGLSALSNGPLTIIIDWTALDFAVGVLLILFLVHYTIQLLIKLWTLIKI